MNMGSGSRMCISNCGALNELELPLQSLCAFEELQLKSQKRMNMKG